MDPLGNSNRNGNNRYDRVMARVHNQSRSSLKSSSSVIRHDMPSSVRVGAKPYVSNRSSGVFSELPTVLNEYVPESNSEKVKRTFIVKPRKTIRSLDPALSPIRTVIKRREISKKTSNIRVQESAPSVLVNNGDKWSKTHLRECLTSKSHSRLKELKDEIQAYKETEKLMRLRSNLYKKCGVVLDDVGNVAEDKAVQVEVTDTKPEDPGEFKISGSLFHQIGTTTVGALMLCDSNRKDGGTHPDGLLATKFSGIQFSFDGFVSTTPIPPVQFDIKKVSTLHQTIKRTDNETHKAGGIDEDVETFFVLKLNE